jgi:hypothetical protein
MSRLRKWGVFFLAALLVVGALEMADQYDVPGVESAVPEAQAIVGRPLTPVSYAGVARRTVRRCAVGVYYC